MIPINRHELPILFHFLTLCLLFLIIGMTIGLYGLFIKYWMQYPAGYGMDEFFTKLSDKGMNIFGLVAGMMETMLRGFVIGFFTLRVWNMFQKDRKNYLEFKRNQRKGLYN